jgi:hypothetical protein
LQRSRGQRKSLLDDGEAGAIYVRKMRPARRQLFVEWPETSAPAFAGLNTASLSGMQVMTRWLNSISPIQSRAYPTNFRAGRSPVMDERGMAEENA